MAWPTSSTGPLPMFEISLKETFNYFGTSKDLLVKLNACVSSKLSLPFSNQQIHRCRIRLPGDRGFLEQYRHHQPERIASEQHGHKKEPPREPRTRRQS